MSRNVMEKTKRLRDLSSEIYKYWTVHSKTDMIISNCDYDYLITNNVELCSIKNNNDFTTFTSQINCIM